MFRTIARKKLLKNNNNKKHAQLSFRKLHLNKLQELWNNILRMDLTKL